MKRLDPALTFPNARMLAAVYFGLLSVVGTILINAFLNSIGIEEIVPVYGSVLLGMVVASCTGAIFGERIIHCSKPYKAKTFWMGFFMVIASLPVFDLGLVLFMKEDYTQLFALTKMHDMVFLYWLVLGYSYLLFGILLAIAAGFAAMYLRGQLIYDILHTHEKRRRHAPLKHALAHRVRVHHK